MDRLLGAAHRAPRDCLALSVTFPCVTSLCPWSHWCPSVTLSPSGAQAAEMPRELWEEVIDGNKEEVKRLLADGADVNEKAAVSGGALQRGVG